MGKNILMKFVDDNYIMCRRPYVLPMFHSCEGYLGIRVFKDGVLKVQKCKVFDKDLLYFFYGKPAYPVADKFSKKRTDDYYCPICFIANPEKVSIYQVYPFDTGAFKAEKFSDFLPRGIELDNYLIDGDIKAIQSYISVMFDNNDNYIDGKCVQSEYDLAEINSLIHMLNANGAFDIDERANTVEVISSNNLDIKDVIECVIIPNSIMRERYVKDFITRHNIKYKTYRFRTLTKPERYYEAIFQLAMEHISEREGLS